MLEIKVLICFPVFMHNRHFLFLLSILVVPVSLFGLAPQASADAKASIKIEQISAKQFGKWTLYSASGTTRMSTGSGMNKNSISFAVNEFGPTTLSVKPPAGMSVKISVYRSGELIETVDVPQYSFTLYPNDNYRLLVQYALTRLGSLGITSNPSGLKLRMKGASTKTYTATTPHTFINIPAGQYSIMIGPTKTCLKPAPHTVVVIPEQRNTAYITLNCDTEKEVGAATRTQPSKRSLREYVEQRERNARGNRK